MKKWIILTERADIAGEVRRPEEGRIAVDTETAEELVEAGSARWPSEDDVAPDAASFEKDA